MPPAAESQTFPLGGDDRCEYTLILNTGHIVATDRRNLVELGSLTAAEITVTAMQNIFDKLGYKSSYDDDGHLFIESDIASVNILIEPEGQWLRFVSGIGLNEFADAELKLALVNRLNDEVQLVRFFIPNPVTLRADYTLTYDAGLSVERIVSTLERFAEIVLAVFAGCEELQQIAEG